jgi:ribonucleoside-diphosphate reductase beta chain
MYIQSFAEMLASNDQQNEPILSNKRVNLYPIMYHDIWEMYQKSKASFWVPEEVDLSTDYTDFQHLDQHEQHFIKMVLAFFAGSDLIVNENLEDEFAELVAIPELKMFYHFQEMMEDIHTAQYQLLIEALVKEEQEKHKLIESTYCIPSIKAKADWARKWIEDGSWHQRLIAFCIIEGIMFSASFASIFWLKKRGIMKGLAQSNEFIARDEGMHRDLAILVYTNHIQNKLETNMIKQMIQEAVTVEIEFVKDCLPYNLTGMNKDLMSQYVQFVADCLAIELIDEKIYHTDNPFVWMQLISLNGKTNFFERKVSSYSRQAVLVTDSKENTVCFDADF